MQLDRIVLVHIYIVHEELLLHEEYLFGIANLFGKRDVGFQPSSWFAFYLEGELVCGPQSHLLSDQFHNLGHWIAQVNQYLCM